MIDFKLSRKDADFVKRVANRAAVELVGCHDKQNTMMDLTACHNHGCKIDFDKLLGFDVFNFAHDIYGINKHINRVNGKLQSCFVPRSAAKETSVKMKRAS